jgi:chemotaxis signal transduction protein
LEQAATKTRSFIPIKIGHLWLALEAHLVQEIVGARPWVPVPHSSALVPGVLAWRSRAVAVVDLSVLASAGEPLRPGVERPRTLVASSRDCMLAMPVDVVREVQDIEHSRIRAPHVTSLAHSVLEVDLFDTLAPVLDLGSVVAAILDVGLGGHDS